MRGGGFQFGQDFKPPNKGHLIGGIVGGIVGVILAGIVEVIRGDFSLSGIFFCAVIGALVGAWIKENPRPGSHRDDHY